MYDQSSVLRCQVESCKKKLTLTNNFGCECGNFYCIKHKFSSDHGCTFDYKNKQRHILEKTLPKIAGEKVIRI